MDHNGPELVITLGLFSLVLAVTGSGRCGLDYLIVTRTRRRAGPQPAGRTPARATGPPENRPRSNDLGLLGAAWVRR
jgi:hypothetical protein